MTAERASCKAGAYGILVVMVAVVALLLPSLSVKADTYLWTPPGSGGNPWYCFACWGDANGFPVNAAPPDDPSTTAIIRIGVPPQVADTDRIAIGQLRLEIGTMRSLGTFSAQRILVGTNLTSDNANDGPFQASFQQFAGVVEASELLEVSRLLGDGEYLLHQGELRSAEQIIGNAGYGRFRHRGGNNTVGGTLWIGKAGERSDLRDNGIYEMVDLSASANPASLLAQVEHVGAASTGRFIQALGIHSVTDTLTLGTEASGKGFYELKDTGELEAATQIIGRSGSGEFTQSGGSNTTTGIVWIGVNGGSVGKYMQSGGTHSAPAMYLGHGVGSRGSYSLTGGELTVATVLHVGTEGSATFEQSGGSLVVNDTLAMGTASPGNGTFKLSGGATLRAETQILGYDGDGTFLQSGGENTTSKLWIGVNSGSHGLYEQTGGHLSILGGGMRLADRAGSEGTYTIRGGTLLTASITGGAGTSALNIDGGQLFAEDGIRPIPEISVTRLTVGAGKGSDGRLSIMAPGQQVHTRSTRVGDAGKGLIEHVRGDHVISGGLTVGVGATGTGNYVLGANLSTVDSAIGVDGSGTFVQLAGTHAVQSRLVLGVGEGGKGEYTLYNGSLTSLETIIGFRGQGTFVQSGGTVGVTTELGLAFMEGSHGTFTQIGGATTVDRLIVGVGGTAEYRLMPNTGDPFAPVATLAAHDVRVGIQGTGSILHEHGSMTVAGGLLLGVNAAGSGKYQLKGAGVLHAGAQIVGSAGAGEFIQSGGQNTTTGDMWIGADPGSVGSYAQSGGTNDVHALDIGRAAGSSGSYRLTGGTLTLATPLRVGVAGDGTFIQAAGEVLTPGLWIGIEDGGTGTYEQTGGKVSLLDEGIRLADQEGSRGTFRISGGVVAASKITGGAGTSFLDIDGGQLLDQDGLAPMPEISVVHLTVGRSKDSDGAFRISGGQQQVTTLSTRVGDAGKGLLEQSGGHLNVSGTLFVGLGATGVGTFTLNGGNLSADASFIGREGNGTFVQLAGSHDVRRDLQIAVIAGSQGSYSLGGGSLTSVTTVVGVGGWGTFIQESGSARVDEVLVLGRDSGSVGRYVQRGGVNTVDRLQLGGNGFGEYRLIGGTLNVRALSAARSDDIPGLGTLVLDGGQFNLAEGASISLGVLRIADSASSRYTYRLEAGKTLDVDDEWIGGDGLGEFIQSGGDHSVRRLVLGLGDTGQGTYSLRGGNLHVSSHIVTEDGTGVLNIEGGTLSMGAFTSIIVDRLNLRGGPSTNAMFTLRDGNTLSIRNESIGEGGKGSLLQSGGAHYVDALHVGAEGILDVTKGTLAVNTELSNRGRLSVTGAAIAGGGVLLRASEANRTYARFGNVAVNEGILEFKDVAVRFNGSYEERGILRGQSATLGFDKVDIDPDGYWVLDAESVIRVHGDFRNGSRQTEAWKTDTATLEILANDQSVGLAGADLGATLAGFSNNFAWRQLGILLGTSVNLEDGNDVAGAALYARVFRLQYDDEGFAYDIDVEDLESLLGNIRSAFNIYYDPSNSANAYLGGQTYALNGAGRLIPVQAVPEPGTWALMLSGVAVLVFAARRRGRTPRWH